MTTDEALDQIAARADPARVPGMEAYHKVARPYLGTPNPALNALAAGWRRDLPVAPRLALAQGLWATNVFEARVAAAKLLTQARLAGDLAVWRCLADWVPEFDSWAIADHAAKAGSLRLLADPARLDEVETWVGADSLWTRRAALVMTLPWTRMRQPSPAQDAARERILGWAARLADDPAWFAQKAVAWWLRDLSRIAPERVRAFLDRNGVRLKPFARKIAARHLA